MKQPFYYQIPYPFPPVTFNLDAEDFPHLSLSYFLLVVISVSITTIYSPLQGGDLHSTLEINMEVNERVMLMLLAILATRCYLCQGTS